MTQFLRIALLIAAGIGVASPTTAQAQDKPKDGEEEFVFPDNGSGMIVSSRDVEPGTLITSKQLEEFLGKTIQVHHKASDTWPTHFVLRTFVTLPTGKTIGQCISGPARLEEGVPMTFPDVCKDGSLTKGLNELGVETLTIESVQWIDGKPINMGLWTKENLDESSLGLSIIVTPAKDYEKDGVQGGTLVMTLKYPIEHG